MAAAPRPVHLLLAALLATLVALPAAAPAALADPVPAASDVPGDWGGADGWDEDDYAGDDDPSADDGGYEEGYDTGGDAAWGDVGVEPDQGGGEGVLPVPAQTRPSPVQALPPVPVRRTIPGRLARLRTDGRAAIPRGAPKRVRSFIAAANVIIGRPCKWGGGHAKLVDRGYDCSGAVSYPLIRTGLLGSPLVSGQLARWASGGRGRWMTIYANRGHVYLEVAGLRLDTSPVGDPTGRHGVRWRPVIGRRGGFAVRHPAGL